MLTIQHNQTTTNFVLRDRGDHWANLMAVSHGFNEGELVVIAARPGCGKTTLALNFAVWAQEHGGVLFESLEMRDVELKARIENFMSEGALEKCTRLFIDDSSELDFAKLERDIDRAKAKFVFIDYLQLMSVSMKTATKELKKIAKEKNCVIIVLAQLNRKAENKEPTLAMLKDSGNIEQDADQVWFICQDHINIAKNRKGDVASVPTLFNKGIGYIFEDLDTMNHNEQLLELCVKARDSKTLIGFAHWARKIKKLDFDFWYDHIRNHEEIPYMFIRRV